MLVIKRDGRRESVKFDKVTARIEKLCYGLHMDFVSPIEVAKKVIDGIYDGVTTVELDNLAAETAASLTTKHPDYAILAARIAVSNLHKVTSKSFSSTMKRLYTYEDPKNGDNASLLATDVWEVIHKNAATLDSAIIYDRDYNYDFFGFKTLERSYLLRLEGKVVERPQHMLMRVSVGIHKDDIDSVIKTYNLLSERWFTHATPTLFNAGTPKPQMSSCFLLTMKDDSIEGIYDTLKNCALISQSAGGIGLSVSNVRATGSYIKGTNGNSNGLVPMLKVFNDTARYVDQGARKAQGRLRHLPGALARRCVRIPRPEEEPRQRGDARPRPILRPLDARFVYEARGGQRRLDPDVPPRVPGPGKQLGPRVREALPEVREGGPRPPHH